MRILLYKYRTYKYCRRLTVGSLRGPTFYITPKRLPPTPLSTSPHPITPHVNNSNNLNKLNLKYLNNLDNLNNLNNLNNLDDLDLTYLNY